MYSSGSKDSEPQTGSFSPGLLGPRAQQNYWGLASTRYGGKQIKSKPNPNLTKLKNHNISFQRLFAH